MVLPTSEQLSACMLQTKKGAGRWCAADPGHPATAVRPQQPRNTSLAFLSVCCRRSFTVGQLQAHKHRLASSTAARSSSPPLAGSSSSHSGRCSHQHNASCTGRGCNKCGVQRPRPSVSSAGGPRREASGSQTSAAGKPLVMSFSGGAYCAGDVRLLSSSPGGLPQRGLLLAESASVEEVGKVSSPLDPLSGKAAACHAVH